MYWNGKNGNAAQNVTVLTSVDEDKIGNRFNDGKADKMGRLWWGKFFYYFEVKFQLIYV